MTAAADVIVVGGGVIGCAVAYELARRSVRVLLLDRSLPGRATSASAGGLWPVGEGVGLGCGVIYHTLDKANHGPPLLPAPFREFLMQSNARFPALAETLRELTGIDIEYAPGAGLLFVMYQDAEWAFVEKVRSALPPGTSVDMLGPCEVARIEPNLTRELLGAAAVAGEHQVNPMLLAEAFKQGAIRHGATFRPDTRATALRRRGDRVVGVEIGDEFLACGTVVNAAGAWASRLAATAGLVVPVEPVRGQIVLTESLPPVLKGCLSTSSCYLAQKAHGEVLVGSTTEKTGFDVAVTFEAIRSLCRGAVQAVPLLRDVRIKRTWAGLRPGTPDELPILGRAAGVDGYLNATGGFRTGIVASPLTGEVVAQMACGEEPCFSPVAFSADRFGSPARDGQALRPAPAAPSPSA
jgi:hydrogen cyanide synthase HcnC